MSLRETTKRTHPPGLYEHGYRIGSTRDRSSVEGGHWWCPTCSVRYDVPKNPVTCPACGDDTTIAPASARKGTT